MELAAIGFTDPRYAGRFKSLTVGLLDVFVLQADAVSTQGPVSAGLDLALGIPLVAVGALVATGRLHGRRRAPAPAGDAQPPKKDGWAQRVLGQPRFGLAVLIGAVAGTPGAAYISALHELGGASETRLACGNVALVIMADPMIP